MAAIHLSCLPRRLLAWLWAHEERFQGTRSASHQDLVQALGHDKGNLSPGAPGDRAAAGQWCIRLSEYPYCATRPKPNKCAIRGNKHDWTGLDARE